MPERTDGRARSRMRVEPREMDSNVRAIASTHVTVMMWGSHLLFVGREIRV